MDAQLLAEIEACIQQKAMASFYRTDLPRDSFLVGVPLSVTQEALTICLFDRQGEDDGVVCFHADDIDMMQQRDAYTHRIAQLVSRTSHDSNICDATGGWMCDSIEAVLHRAMNMGCLVGVHSEVNAGDVTVHYGIVQQVDDETLMLETLNETGGRDACVLVDILSVTAVEHATKACRARSFLAERCVTEQGAAPQGA